MSGPLWSDKEVANVALISACGATDDSVGFLADTTRVAKLGGAEFDCAICDMAGEDWTRES